MTITKWNEYNSDQKYGSRVHFQMCWKQMAFTKIIFLFHLNNSHSSVGEEVIGAIPFSHCKVKQLT